MGLVKWMSKPPEPSATQTHEPKMKVAPLEGVMVLKAKVPLPSAPAVSVYCQACSGIPLAVGFVGRDRRLWNSIVQGTQRFRQVRTASCVIPYVLCGGLYCLRCRCLWRGSLPALTYPGDRVTWKVLAEYSWSPTTTQSGSFFCTAASTTRIRVVTREAKYIHELSLTLEHSMSVSSPVAPGLTSPRALCS